MPPAYLRAPPEVVYPPRKTGCTGKVAHRERGHALRAAKAMNQTHARAYECRHCGMWHLTTMDRKAKK